MNLSVDKRCTARDGKRLRLLEILPAVTDMTAVKINHRDFAVRCQQQASNVKISVQPCQPLGARHMLGYKHHHRVIPRHAVTAGQIAEHHALARLHFAVSFLALGRLQHNTVNGCQCASGLLPQPVLFFLRHPDEFARHRLTLDPAQKLIDAPAVQAAVYRAGHGESQRLTALNKGKFGIFLFGLRFVRRTQQIMFTRMGVNLIFFVRAPAAAHGQHLTPVVHARKSAQPAAVRHSFSHTPIP